MPASKAQQRATNKYIAKAYDRINLTVAKGRKEIIQALAEAQGQSVNAYINAAIDSRIVQESTRATGAPATPTPNILSPSTLKTAQEAAQAAGEAIPEFIARAVDTQAQRDALGRKLEGGEQQ